ncbi:hypothetical protein [Kordiimonas sp.]|uniref:hypothetical protein n=1 Tax=Kordiimonas sp. TaxID=1970157 RepID=UPI003A955288
MSHKTGQDRLTITMSYRRYVTHAPAIIVWFGEMPFYMDEIAHRLHACDLFISFSTSGTVYPAAGFVAEVRNAGDVRMVDMNLEPSTGVSYFAECCHGRAGELVPKLVDELLV